jgi:hypothetical protein
MDEMQWGRSRLRDHEGRGVVQWWGGTLEPRTFLVATAYTWQSMKQVGLYRACSPQPSCRQACILHFTYFVHMHEVVVENRSWTGLGLDWD